MTQLQKLISQIADNAAGRLTRDAESGVPMSPDKVESVVRLEVERARAEVWKAVQSDARAATAEKIGAKGSVA